MARIAFLSTAHIHTRQFLENIAKATDGRIAHVIWDDVPERGRRYAEEFKTPFVADLDAALRDPEVDGFLICAENTRHLPLLSKVIPVGKPVFCEKPLSTNDADLAATLALLEKTPAATVFCGYYIPFAGDLQGARRLVEAGAFGKITHVQYTNAHHAAYGRWFDNPDLAWFHNPELSGGGAFMDMGTHAVHTLCTLFGPVEAVWAEIANRCGEYPECDDHGVAHLRFKNGVFGTVEANWIMNGGPCGLSIMGSKQALWPVAGGKHLVGAPGKEPSPLESAPARPDRVDRLVAVIRGQVPAAELAADRAAIVMAVKVMSAAYRSARDGGWVKIEQ